MNEAEGRVAKRLLGVLSALSAVLLAGAAGYHFIEGWPLLDSLYMSVITLSTVGYGEVHPLTSAGRLFTMFLILGGIAVVTLAFSTVTALIVEGEISQAYQRRRMQKEIDALAGHYLVCGAGHTGAVIAEELRKTGRDFVLIDKSVEACMGLAERLGPPSFLYMVGDATQDAVLQAAGITRAAGLFAVLPYDQDNAFVALSAKGLNPEVKLIATQKESGVREKLLRSGANQVVDPDFIGGLRMASEMIRPAAVGFLDSMIHTKGDVVRFEEITVAEKSPVAGRAVSQFRQAAGAPLLVAILNPSTGQYDINPDQSRILKVGERLVVIGERGQIARFQGRAG